MTALAVLPVLIAFNSEDSISSICCLLLHAEPFSNYFTSSNEYKRIASKVHTHRNTPAPRDTPQRSKVEQKAAAASWHPRHRLRVLVLLIIRIHHGVLLHFFTSFRIDFLALFLQNRDVSEFFLSHVS
jgi:hypothetical protein